MKKTLFALAVLAGLAGTANASELSYSYVEASYINSDDFDGNSTFDYNGWGVRGSLALGDNFYLLGEYNVQSDKFFDTKVDFDTYEIGVGFHHGISEKVDFFADVSYADLKLNVKMPGFSSDVDDSGYTARAGVRCKFAEKFEGTAALLYRNRGIFENDSSLLLGGHYKFTENFGLVASMDVDSESAYSVGVRATF